MHHPRLCLHASIVLSPLSLPFSTASPPAATCLDAHGKPRPPHFLFFPFFPLKNSSPRHSWPHFVSLWSCAKVEEGGGEDEEPKKKNKRRRTEEYFLRRRTKERGEGSTYSTSGAGHSRHEVTGAAAAARSMVVVVLTPRATFQ